MQNNRELHEERTDRASAVNSGIIIAVLAIFAVFGIAMWYGGWFGDTNTANAPAPSGSSGTVGQATQNPGPAKTNR